MPNWCYNRLQVTGPARLVEDFAEQVNGPDGVLDFGRTVPMPPVLQPRDAVPVTDWYSWQVAHWGVKWGATSAEIAEQSPGKVVYLFDTPWGPPVEWLARTAKLFPALLFDCEWEEPGMDFAGAVTFADGREDR